MARVKIKYEITWEHSTPLSEEKRHYVDGEGEEEISRKIGGRMLGKRCVDY